MARPAFNPGTRFVTLRAAVLAVACLGAWLGLLPGAIARGIDGPIPAAAATHHLERPATHTETCLSRSSRLPSHLQDRGDSERAASEPPRSVPVLPVWLDELPRHPAHALTSPSLPGRDHSLSVPPRQPRGPPLAPRA